MIETATSASASELQKTGNWAGADYTVVRTNPSTQCDADFATGGSFRLSSIPSGLNGIA